MQSTALEIFRTAVEQAQLEAQLVAAKAADEETEPGVEAICSEEQEPADEPVVNASFVYSILNGDNDSPHLTTEVDDFSTDNLESLAKLIAPMSHPQFFYLVLNKVQQDFAIADREMDFAYFMQKIEEQKAEFESNMGDPYITPLELSKRDRNE